MGAEQTNLRAWRIGQELSLDQVCDLLKEYGLERPSAAKLSRIERDQSVPPEMIPALVAITGIPAKDIRPDLAKLFLNDVEAAE